MPRAPTQATLRSSGLVLLVAFALTIGSFLVAALVAELSERGIYEAANRIVNHSSPSVSHLSGMLTALRHLEVELDDAADRLLLEGQRPADRQAIGRAHDQLLDAWKAYIAMPAFEDEQARWPNVSEKLQSVSEQVGRIGAQLEGGDGAGARRAIAADLKPALDRVDVAVGQLRALNVAREAQLASRIATLRERAIKLAVVLGLASLLLGSLSAVFAVRIVHQSTRLLVQRADELETFAGRVAHDIKSPLSSVNLSFDMIRRKIADDPPFVAMIERGKRGVARTAATVDALLAFARASAGPTPGARADVGEVLEEVLEDLRPIAEERRIQLAATELTPCRLACSPGLLWTLFSNLIGNALKYMGDAPVRRVTVRVTRVDDRVHIDVEDTGPGIRSELCRRMFDPYVRAPDATEPGIGLGLATVRRVVEAHGGRVGVDSESGRGSRFWVEMPREA